MEHMRRETILIIDDDAINRAILEQIFGSDYDVLQAENGKIGLEMILKNPQGLCAVLLDVVMPEMDGLEALRQMRRAELLQHLPVFLITAESGDAVLKEAYGLGVMDVIGKPVIPYVVRRRVQSVIELFQARKRLSRTVESQQERLLRQQEEIVELNQGIVEALAAAIEFRSEESGDHVRRIHDITAYLLSETELGNGLSSDEIAEIAQASMLHDVGKIAVPDRILNKPGRLTPEEFEIMKTHTTVGAALLEGIPQQRRDAEWYYLRGRVFYVHGWLDQAYSYYTRAVQMNPGNAEYQTALNQLMWQRNTGRPSGGYGDYRNVQSGGMSGCDMCSGLICADCCCECMGGDLISCC